MNFEIASDKIIGHPNQGGWGLVHDFTPKPQSGLPDLAKSHGRLVAVISVKKNQAAPISAGLNEEVLVGRKILGRLHEGYFGKKGSQIEMLKKAVDKVTKEFSSQNQTLDLIAASFSEDAVFIVGHGDVSSFILRQGTLAQIIKGEEKTSSASGRIRPGDVYLLTTNNLFKIAPFGVLKAALGSQKFSESISPQIHSDSTFSTLGSLVLKIESSPQLIKQELPAPKINAYQAPVMGASPVRRKAVALIDKIISVLPERKIFIRGQEFNPSRKKQVAVSVGVMLLLLLGVSISFGIRQRQEKLARSKYEGKLTQAQHDYSEAQSLSSLNPARARELVLGAKTSVDDLISQGIRDPRLDRLSNDIGNGLGNIAGIYQTTPNLYLDLPLLSSGLKADDIAISQGRIVVLDRSGKKLISIDEESKKSEVVAGPDIMPSALGLAVYSDRNFAVSNDGIWEVGQKAELVIKKDWDGDVLTNAYTGNIYVLEKLKNTVWRFVGDGGTFETKQNWFGEGVNPDLSNVISWSIDGSIWMLTQGGKILRFSQGSPQGFSLQDMDKPISRATDIFTNEETNFIYILDPQNSRIVVIDKNGKYKAQYLSNQLREAKHIVVSESDKKIIFLTGPKLYSIDIKHL